MGHFVTIEQRLDSGECRKIADNIKKIYKIMVFSKKLIFEKTNNNKNDTI